MCSRFFVIVRFVEIKCGKIENESREKMRVRWLICGFEWYVARDLYHNNQQPMLLCLCAVVASATDFVAVITATSRHCYFCCFANTTLPLLLNTLKCTLVWRGPFATIWNFLHISNSLYTLYQYRGNTHTFRIYLRTIAKMKRRLRNKTQQINNMRAYTILLPVQWKCIRSPRNEASSQ